MRITTYRNVSKPIFLSHSINKCILRKKMQGSGCFIYVYKGNDKDTSKPKFLVILSGHIILKEIERLLFSLTRKYCLVILCDSWSAILFLRSKISQAFLTLQPYTCAETVDGCTSPSALATVLISWADAVCVAAMGCELLSQVFLPPSSLLAQVVQQVSSTEKPHCFTSKLCVALQRDANVAVLFAEWRRKGWVALLLDHHYPSLDLEATSEEIDMTLLYIELAMLRKELEQLKAIKVVLKALKRVLLFAACVLFLLCVYMSYVLMLMMLIHPTLITY